MNNIGKIQRLFMVSLLSCTALLAGPTVITEDGDIAWKWSGKFRPETFYAQRVSLLNKNVREDRFWYMRHVLELSLNTEYGMATHGEKVAEFKMTLRNKGVWGNHSGVIPTRLEEFKLLDARLGEHRHDIPRHLLWMREAWLELDLSKALCLSFCREQKLTVGSFPFELGRGIALGNAYAVGQGALGFYTDVEVDQYAFGGKLSGELPYGLEYDFYAAVLDNKSSSLKETGANIFGQQYGRIERPQRGYGHVNFVVAGRTKWHAIDQECYGLVFEPYWLYNSDPEQKVEFRGDASSKLGTFGLAMEFASDRFEVGFDTAFNVGSQTVKGWDRNQVEIANINGMVRIQNSHVLMGKDTFDNAVAKAPFAKASLDTAGAVSTFGKDIQNIVDMRAFEDESQNGKQIVSDMLTNDTGVIYPGEIVNGDQVTLFNAKDRFRNPYKNKYQGWMFVGDAAWWRCDKKVRLAAMAGVASGDANPNDEEVDRVYSGFIPLQELYAGNRVKSVFLLGGSGKLKRVLSDRRVRKSPNRFSQSVSGFTDIIFVGGSYFYESTVCDKKWDMMPNVIAYWKHHPIGKFDIATKESTCECASRFLGVEANMYLNMWMFKAMKFYCVTSFFIPGQHYKDIQGTPFNKEQAKSLDRGDRTGFDSAVQGLSHDTAFTFNIGMEFKF